MQYGDGYWKVNSKMKKLLIEGMHCASCASNVERSLKKVEGVKSVSVSLMTKKAIIDVDTNVKDEDLKKAVSRAGYKLIKIE
nr:heavy metal transport/detoxification protein [Nanoarchaeum sp.]